MQPLPLIQKMLQPRCRVFMNPTRQGRLLQQMAYVRSVGSKHPERMRPDRQQGPATVPGLVLYTSKAWLVFAALYTFFAGQISLTEVIAGASAAALAAICTARLHNKQSRHIRLRAPWPKLLLRPLAALVTDTVRVGAILVSALWRRPNGPVGMITKQPFRHAHDKPDSGMGDKDAAVDAGRRGLVTLAASVAPNGYVVRIPHDQDALIMHRLAAVAPSEDTAWPI